MLINLSNHPLTEWGDKQKKTAEKKFGRILDISFPAISPNAGKTAIEKKAKKFVELCIEEIKFSGDKNNAVHIMGELTFCYAIINLLKKKKIKCVASTTTRKAWRKNNLKTSRFSFVKFREY